jgi:hypothetical protein
MKIKCPVCGAKGTDVEPVPEHLRGPSWSPSKGEEDYAFAVHGREGSRAVRKCLNCGAGIYVKLLPPRFQAIPPDRRELMQEYFEDAMEAHAERMEREARVRDAATDPEFNQQVEALLERLNELWAGPKNPLVRERNEGPDDIEHALIRHIVRSTSANYVIDAMERDEEPDRAQMDRETRVLMFLAAGGYLWREAERENIGQPPMEEAEFAVEWMNDHPTPGEDERFERLARGIFWMLEGLGPFALPSDDGVDNEAALEVGFEAMALFACEEEGLHPSEITLGQDGMRAAFNAGIALREVEPLVPSCGRKLPRRIAKPLPARIRSLL